MSYREPEASDPHELVGVVLPGDETSTREMAAAFAEEFARFGWPRERILTLFGDPGYRAAYAAREVLGDDEIRSIVDDAMALWGALRVELKETPCRT